MAGKAGPYLSAGLIATAAVIVLALYTGEQWLAPLTPLVIGAAAALPLGFVGALLLHPEARSAPSLFLKLSSLLVVAALVGVGVPALWSLPQVRTAALEHAGEHLNLLAAVDDPDAGVQTMACAQILDGELSISEATQALAVRPALAARCVAGAERANTTIVAENLASHWYDRLVSQEPSPPEHPCIYAESLGALPTEPGVEKARLLDCALRAPHAEKRMCCVDTLMESGAACEELAAQVDARVLVEAGSAGTLLALSHDEETVRRELEGVSRRLNLSCEAMQRVGLQLACVTAGRPQAADIDNVVGWLFEEHSGCMSPEQREEDVDIESVCHELMKSVRRGGDLDERAICRTQRAVVDEQIARREQLRGLSAEESEALAGQIALGGARADNRDLNFEQFMASLEGREGAPPLESYSDADRRKIMEAMQNKMMGPEEGMAVSMDALDEVQAAYEGIKDHDKAQAALEGDGKGPPEGFDATVKMAREKLEQTNEHVDSARAKAKAEQDKENGPKQKR